MQWVPLYQLQVEVSSDLVAAARLYSDQTEAAKRESGEYLIPLKEAD